MNMRLLGARTIGDLTPDMVDANALHSHVGLTPVDNLYNTTCESISFDRVMSLLTLCFEDQPLALAQFKNKL
jgi:L-lactate dehydrogenase (cytochrome)